MAKEQQRADQTEKPTPKRLKDARKEGNVSKSKELSSTFSVLGWLALAWLTTSLVWHQLSGLIEKVLDFIPRVGRDPLPPVWLTGGKTVLLICVPLLLAAGLLGLLIEFLQVGGLFVPKRLVPDAGRLNPIEGLKRMFSQDNLVEVVKSVFKTLAMVVIFVLVLLRELPEIIRLPMGTLEDAGAAHWHALLWLGIWAVCVFFALAVLDAGYQRFAFIKKLKMSRRDIRQELRDTEGDPYTKGRRKQLHQEWAQQNMLAAVRSSSAVVVNPEHIAVAILYDADKTALPVLVAKGEDHEAQLIREAAEEAGVPIMRNVELARGLHENIAIDQYVSPEFFEAIAQVLRWAESVRRQR
jgi:type III secretion protein U